MPLHPLISPKGDVPLSGLHLELMDIKPSRYQVFIQLDVVLSIIMLKMLILDGLKYYKYKMEPKLSNPIKLRLVQLLKYLTKSQFLFNNLSTTKS